eukprot:SAG31_NODE_1346_length_8698_cov_1.561693_3_plen_268_part_00
MVCIFGHQDSAKATGQLEHKTTLLRLTHSRLTTWLDEIKSQLDVYTRASRGRSLQNMFVPTDVGAAGTPTKDKQQLSYAWADIKGWATQAEGFRRWLDSLANLFAERLIEYEGHGSEKRIPDSSVFGKAKAGVLPPKSPPNTPIYPCASRVIAANEHYSHDAYVTKRYKLAFTEGTESGGWDRKRLSYNNPRAVEMRLTLHTDRPDILNVTNDLIVIPPFNMIKLLLSIKKPTAGQLLPAAALIRLWIHDEERGVSEECIELEVSAT